MDNALENQKAGAISLSTDDKMIMFVVWVITKVHLLTGFPIKAVWWRRHNGQQWAACRTNKGSMADYIHVPTKFFEMIFY